MTDFETAARKAAEAIERAKSNAPDEWFLIPVTEMTEIITKHYAGLAETFGLLVEVVKMQNAQRIHRESFMKFQDHVDANKHKTGIAVNARLAELFANPRIAALLAEKKG